MSELFFVLKSFVITVLLVMAMQVKVGNYSVEQYSHWWLTRSSVALYIQSVAAGGAMALRNLTHTVKTSVTGSSAQAGR